jgi:hypothetical protein
MRPPPARVNAGGAPPRGLPHARLPHAPARRIVAA